MEASACEDVSGLLCKRSPFTPPYRSTSLNDERIRYRYRAFRL